MTGRHPARPPVRYRDHGGPRTLAAIDPALEERLLTGRREPPAPWRRLRAGDVDVELDGIELRRVEWRGIELAQQVYVAVRDEPWNALPATIEDLVVTEGDGPSFQVTFGARHQHGELDFGWRGTITGSADGTIRYGMEGEARTAFSYNRIGLNVHHAASSARGAPYRAWLDTGVWSGHLPVEVGPQIAFAGRLRGMLEPLSVLELDLPEGPTVRFEMDGDVFETEDQRNYGDGSFKTYSTPLQWSAPFRLGPGDHLGQSMTIRRRSRRARAGARRRPRSAGSTLRLAGRAGAPLPVTGFGYPSEGGALTARERDRVRVLRPHHLRLELDAAIGPEGMRERLGIAATDARAVGARLWVELRLGDRGEATHASLPSDLMADLAHVDTLLVAARPAEGPDTGTPAALLAAVRDRFDGQGRSPRVGSATDFLAQSIRTPFAPDAIGVLAFGLTPTVHRVDDQSIIENLACLGDEVLTARARMGGRPVLVGPVSLAARRGPYPGGPAGLDGLPAPVDIRQGSLLAAAWTLGCLSELIAAGADAITWYEAVGWRGLVERDSGSPLPATFPSAPGDVFPLWHLFADLADLTEPGGARVLPCVHTGDGLAAIAVRGPRWTSVLLANLRREDHAVGIEGLSGTAARVRTLSTSTAAAARRDPLGFRSQGESASVSGGRLSLMLQPYALVRIDLPRPGAAP